MLDQITCLSTTCKEKAKYAFLEIRPSGVKLIHVACQRFHFIRYLPDTVQNRVFINLSENFIEPGCTSKAFFKQIATLGIRRSDFCKTSSKLERKRDWTKRFSPPVIAIKDKT